MSCPTRTRPTFSASSMGWRRPDCPSDLFLHEGIEIRRRDRMVEIGEGPLLLHLLRRVQKAAHGGAVERGGEADALDAGGLEVGLGEGTALDADHEVERLVERAANLLYRGKVGQAGGHQTRGGRRLDIPP